MAKTNYLKLLMKLSKINAYINRRFSIQGLGLTDLMVLNYLNEATDAKMRPVDLAEKLGLTASGVTRVLLPMEKIGLVKRMKEKNDARISYAALAPAGKRILGESLERADLLSQELFAASKEDLAEALQFFR